MTTGGECIFHPVEYFEESNYFGDDRFCEFNQMFFVDEYCNETVAQIFQKEEPTDVDTIIKQIFTLSFNVKYARSVFDSNELVLKDLDTFIYLLNTDLEEDLCDITKSEELCYEFCENFCLDLFTTETSKHGCTNFQILHELTTNVESFWIVIKELIDVQGAMVMNTLEMVNEEACMNDNTMCCERCCTDIRTPTSSPIITSTNANNITEEVEDLRDEVDQLQNFDTTSIIMFVVLFVVIVILLVIVCVLCGQHGFSMS